MGKIYALIENDRVREIIRSEGVFENIPIQDRYPEDVVSNCVECDDTVQEGMYYDKENNKFTE